MHRDSTDLHILGTALPLLYDLFIDNHATLILLDIQPRPTYPLAIDTHVYQPHPSCRAGVRKGGDQRQTSTYQYSRHDLSNSSRIPELL